MKLIKIPSSILGDDAIEKVWIDNVIGKCLMNIHFLGLSLCGTEAENRRSDDSPEALSNESQDGWIFKKLRPETSAMQKQQQQSNKC